MSVVRIYLLVVLQPLHDTSIRTNSRRLDLGEELGKGVCEGLLSEDTGRGDRIGEELSDDLIIHRRACTDRYGRAIGSDEVVLRRRRRYID